MLILLYCVNIWKASNTQLSMVKWTNFNGTVTESLRNINDFGTFDIIYLNNMTISDTFATAFDTANQLPYKEDTDTSTNNNREHLKNGYYELRHRNVYFAVDMSKSGKMYNFEYYCNTEKSVNIYSKQITYNNISFRIVCVSGQPTDDITSDSNYNIAFDLFTFIKTKWSKEKDLLIVGNAHCHNPHSVFKSVFKDTLSKYVVPDLYNSIGFNTSFSVGNNDILIVTKNTFNNINYEYRTTPGQSYSNNMIFIKMYKTFSLFSHSRCISSRRTLLLEKKIADSVADKSVLFWKNVGKFNSEKHKGCGMVLQQNQMSLSDAGPTIWMNNFSNF